jgi:hypothetical protein
MNRSQRTLIAAALAAALLIPLVVGGQTTTINVTYTTTAPLTGSPVHHYVWQTSANGTAWTTLAQTTTGLSITIAAPVGVNILVRCAGVDASTRQGSWSEVSDPFVPDAGAPAAPGKPARQ